MKKGIFTTIASIFALTLSAQSPKEVVKIFFDGMYNIDTQSLKNYTIKDPAFHTTSIAKNLQREITSGKIGPFMKTIAVHKKGELNEQITNVKENIFGDAATVSMDYDFFYKGKFSHCGVNIFHLLKDDIGWKITGIDDTRNTKSCHPPMVEKANVLLDNWHMAATRADSATYFGMLHDRSIFIGTDSSEVWTKAQFAKYAGPYFAKGKAWDFKKVSRHVYYEADKKMLWFDEMLNTWMGPCRGSGYIDIDADGKYSIMQYVLSMTVPNDKVNGVIEIISGVKK
jgi:hypothetical protein